MTAETANNIMPWWQEQSFSGKELFRLDDDGSIILRATPLLKERVIAIISTDNCEEALKNLVDGFEFVESKVRETEVEWLAAEDKIKMADKVAQLKDVVNSAAAVGDFERCALLVADWEKAIQDLQEERLQAKKKLVEMAESLAESTQWKETAQAFKEITDQWRQSGFLDKGRNDAMWNRIEAARKAFYDKKRDHHEDEEKDLLVTLDLKIELAEKAEALALSDDWKSTTDAYNKILDDWKAVGRTLPKKNEELWQRIMTAKNTFFERKRIHFNQIQKEQEANYILKLALAERAEALKDSTEWSNTAQAFMALTDEWKKVGRVPQEKSDEIRKRFNDATEFFFEARRKHTEEVRVAMDGNYALKSALLQRAEELKDSSRWGEATAEMNNIFEEWKKIGPVPREISNSMWESFIAARKHFFARKDADRDQRKQFAVAQQKMREELEIADKKAKIAHDAAQRKARIQHAHNTVTEVTAELKEEEEKLADFKVAIENITPGKKAEELRSHLAALIIETEAGIKRLSSKLLKVKEELKQTEDRERVEEPQPAND